MSIESMMPSNHLIFCHPLLLLPSVFPSIRVFSNESVLRIRWPKYWSFSFSISPSNEYSGLICFRMDWLDLLAVQGTLKSLLQHHSSKASILRRSAFLTVLLSHPYMTAGQTIGLTRWTFVSKVMSLLLLSTKMKLLQAGYLVRLAPPHPHLFSIPQAPSEYVAPLLKNLQWLPSAFCRGQPSLTDLQSRPYPQLAQHPGASMAAPPCCALLSPSEKPQAAPQICPPTSSELLPSPVSSCQALPGLQSLIQSCFQQPRPDPPSPA